MNKLKKIKLRMKWGIRQRDNDPTREQTTTEDHQ